MKKVIHRITAFVLIAVLAAGLFPVHAFAASLYKLGDVDMDNAITASDARLALRMTVLLESYTYANRKLCDVSGNGAIDAADARLILRVSVGLENLYGTVVMISESDKNQYIYKAEEHSSGDVTLTHYVPPMPVASSVHGTFTFTVYGYGHGLGMSQYGALALDDMGYTYDKILKHYYNNITIAKDPTYQSSTYYEGAWYDTEQLLARIVYQEINGQTSTGYAKEAIKAQAVAVYTLLKYYDFNVSASLSVGYASPVSYLSLPDALKTAVKQVLGMYMYYTPDAYKTPILSIYGAAAGGKTADPSYIWGGYYPYLVPAESSFDQKTSVGITTFTIPKETMRSMIMAYDSSIVLSSDPADWLEIVSHSASVDASRGYVKQIRVGNKYLSGYTQFCDGLMSEYFWQVRYFGGSSCFMIQYTA